ncbi:hypothetical protein N9153_01680 [Planctomicrobium sp.]|nr:hypothetical protein [Planctomicrobium sp.]
MTDTAQDPNNSSETEKPKRNPIERLVVWGVILVGVFIACTEGAARFGYSMSLNALQDRVHDDEGADANPLTITAAEKLLVGFPEKEEGNERVTFRFKGLVKEFGAIHLKHDDEGLILGLETDAPPEVEEEKVPEFTNDATEPNGDGNMGGPGMGAGMGSGGGEGGNFDPMQFDEDKDGKVSLEEASDRIRESFSEFDIDGDGFIDADEFAAHRAARQQEREAGSPESDRPQRPEVEASESTEEATEPTSGADEAESTE